jgi:hypothetical protein
LNASCATTSSSALMSKKSMTCMADSTDGANEGLIRGTVVVGILKQLHWQNLHHDRAFSEECCYQKLVACGLTLAPMLKSPT